MPVDWERLAHCLAPASGPNTVITFADFFAKHGVSQVALTKFHCAATGPPTVCAHPLHLQAMSKALGPALQLPRSRSTPSGFCLARGLLALRPRRATCLQILLTWRTGWCALATCFRCWTRGARAAAAPAAVQKPVAAAQGHRPLCGGSGGGQAGAQVCGPALKKVRPHTAHIQKKKRDGLRLLTLRALFLMPVASVRAVRGPASHQLIACAPWSVCIPFVQR